MLRQGTAPRSTRTTRLLADTDGNEPYLIVCVRFCSASCHVGKKSSSSVRFFRNEDYSSVRVLYSRLIVSETTRFVLTEWDVV